MFMIGSISYNLACSTVLFVASTTSQAMKKF